jgi:hypothetical protein
VKRGRRIMAARYLRTLATIECLSALGNDSEARRLLAGIDPIEARELASELDAERDGQVIPLGSPVVIALFPQSLDAHKVGA